MSILGNCRQYRLNMAHLNRWRFIAGYFHGKGTFSPYGTFKTTVYLLFRKLSWYLSACKLYCDPEMENPPWKVEILFRIRFLSENKTILQEVEVLSNFGGLLLKLQTSHIFEKESNVTTQKGWRFLVENVELVKFISLEMLIVDFAGLR